MSKKLWTEIELLYKEAKMAGIEKKDSKTISIIGEMGISYDKLDVLLVLDSDEIVNSIDGNRLYQIDSFTEDSIIVKGEGEIINIALDKIKTISPNICVNANVIDGHFRANKFLFDLYSDKSDVSLIDEKLTKTWKEILNNGNKILVVNKQDKKNKNWLILNNDDFSLEEYKKAS